MGKTNKGQRTKGNTRPSSSVQSALLLNASGRSFGGFVGFDSPEKEPVYLPVTGQPDESGVDADFRMVLRRMIKRDALTRLKAVQEFGEYCSSKDVDTVKSILPFWPRLFNKLALDCDRRIREAVHGANGRLAGKVRRDYAPYLRNVLGVWLLGQCDAHAPSASAARAAFAETFPPDKRARALLFCKAEIFAYFKENLCDPSKFLNDVNVGSPEEARGKQVFALSSTLLAIKLLFSEVKAGDIDSLSDDFGKIVSEPKFWSYLKHKEPQVRCAWYSLLSCLCGLKVEVFLEATKGRSSSVLVACLAEKDPGAVAAAWEAALHVLCHFGVCEQRDFEHSILPQLWSFLREGGRGNASALYPCLLPMLSKFPREVTLTSHFQLKFLDTLLKSLFLENVKNSRMECDAILGAFFECFAYFCLNLDSEREVLMEKVLLQQVLPLIESSIYDEQCSHLIPSKLYPQLGILLCKMTRVNEGACHEAFASASITFWTEIFEIATKFDTRKKTVAPSRQIILLFRGLFDPDAKLERQSVRFEETEAISTVASKRDAILKVSSEDDVSKVASDNGSISRISSEDDVSKGTSEDDAIPKVSSEDNVAELAPEGDLISDVSTKDNVSKVALKDDAISKVSSKDNVSEIASKGCLLEGDAISKIAVIPKPSFLMRTDSPSRGCLMKMLTFLYKTLCEKFDAHLLKILKELLALTLSVEVFQELLTMVGKSEPSEFLQEGMLRWLGKGGNSVEYIVDVVFLVCGCVSVDAGLAILGGCCEKKDIMFLGKILDRARARHEEEPFQTWLQSMEWMDILLDGMKEALSCLPGGNIESCRIKELQSALDLCLTDTILRKIMTSGDKDEQLLRCIGEGLRNLPENICTKSLEAVLLPVCEVVCVLLRNVEHRQEVRNDVVTLMFCMILDLGKTRGKADFVTAAWTIWEAAISNVGPAVADGLILQIAREFHSRLLRRSTSEAFLVNMPDAVYRILGSSGNLASETNLEDRALEVVLPSDEEWEVVWEGLFHSNLPCHVENKIFRPFLCEHDVEVREDGVRSMILVSRVCALLLIGKCERYREKGLHFDGFLTEQLSQLLRSVSFCAGNGFVTEDILSDTQCEDLRIYCDRILFRLSAGQVEGLLRLVVGRATSRFSGWPATLSLLLELLGDLRVDVGRVVLEMLALARESGGENGKVAVQLLLQQLSPERKLVELRELHCRFEEADPASPESFDLVGDLCCLLQDSEVLNSDSGSRVAGSVLASLPRMDAENNRPPFALSSVSLLRHAVNRTGGLGEEGWRLLERVFEEMLRETIDCGRLDDADLLHLHTLFSLGLILFEQATRCAEKSYVPFPRDCRPEVPDSVYEKFVLLFLGMAGEDARYPPLFRAVDRVLAVLQEALRLVPEAFLSSWAVKGRQMDHLVSALSAPLPRLQYAAHSLLTKCLSPSGPAVPAEEDDAEGTFPPELDPLLDYAAYVGDLVTGLLAEFRIGDICVFVPRTDAYRLGVGFLLAWLEIFEFLSRSPSQLRPGRISVLQERGLLPALFSDVFRLLPEDPTACTEEGGRSSLFTVEGAARPEGPPESGQLHALACLVYIAALRRTPACVRTWFNNLDKQSADVVTCFTQRYVSGMLIAEELRPVQEGGAPEGMAVRARVAAREVWATYRVDDCELELCVRLPPSFPLAPVAAERGGNVARALTEWRTWLMQLTTVLNYQDCSVLEGLRLWKRNLDKKFEGVEECTICYYILHNASLKLPKLSCHTCKKKFHSACLYKWFHTSNNSTCPLCRNEFII